MALSMRFERMTCSLGGSRSIQLSYESPPIMTKTSTFVLFPGHPVCHFY